MFRTLFNAWIHTLRAFRKGRKAHRHEVHHWGSDDALVFRDAGAAFAYACEFLDCPLVADTQLVGLVVFAPSLHDMPPPYYEVKVASSTGGIRAFAGTLTPGEAYRAGELVAFWYTGARGSNGYPHGFISARLLPELHRERGWRKAEQMTAVTDVKARP